MSQFYFAVFTYPGGITPVIERNVLHLAETFDQCIVVKEYGKSTKNSHLNFVYSSKCESFASNATRIFRKVYPSLPEGNIKNLVKNKRCSTPENVIGGYLTKESKAEILLNKGFDVEAMRSAALNNIKKIKLTIFNIVPVIREYLMANLYISTNFKHNYNQPEYKEFLFILQCMFRDGYISLNPYLQKPKVLQLHTLYLAYYSKLAFENFI